MIDDELELPFDWHTSSNGDASVCTTEPENDVDRNECRTVALIPAGVDPNNGPGDLDAEDMARFIAKAMNAYVDTPAGLEHWKRVVGH